MRNFYRGGKEIGAKVTREKLHYLKICTRKEISAILDIIIFVILCLELFFQKH